LENANLLGFEIQSSEQLPFPECFQTNEKLSTNSGLYE